MSLEITRKKASALDAQLMDGVDRLVERTQRRLGCDAGTARQAVVSSLLDYVAGALEEMGRV